MLLYQMRPRIAQASHRGALHSVPGDNVRFVADDVYGSIFSHSFFDFPLLITDTVKVIKIARLRWLVHLFRIQELESCRKLTLLKPEGT
jgi:hypothetical protein